MTWLILAALALWLILAAAALAFAAALTGAATRLPKDRR